MKSQDRQRSGLLIVNADDWGRDRLTTQRILDCVRRGAVSSTSAMVFMEDSSRAADVALERGIDAGLHLNFTTNFSSRRAPARVREHQERVAFYLTRHRLAQVVFHPGLTDSFEYVVAAQLDEFSRLYGREPSRIDSHHHMHLCANVMLQKLLPSGTLVRRNFSFQRGDKGLVNRTYRQLLDCMLRHRHRLVDLLFALPPPDAVDRLQRIVGLSKRFLVEVETHPINLLEYRFLAGGEVFGLLRDVRIARSFAACLPKP